MTTSADSGLQAKAADYQVGAAAKAQLTTSRSDRVDLPNLVFTDSKVQDAAFTKADKNRDNVLDQSEIQERLTKPGLSKQERGVLSEMDAAFEQLKLLRTGEVGHDRGITRLDMLENQARRGDGRYADSLQQSADKARLTEAARAKMSPAQFESFKESMEAFEIRMKGNPAEINKTYKQIERLLNPPGGKSLPNSKQMTNLAADVMHHSANPRSIQQDLKNTCALAALEARMYTRHPSEAARMVADVATTGGYTTTDGSTHVAMDKGSVATYPDFWRNKTPGQEYESRSHASQIFQVTASNLFIQTEGTERGNKYVIREKGGQIEEGTIDSTGKMISDGPGTTVFDGKYLNQLNNKIAGVKEPDCVIDTLNSRTPEEFRRTWDKLKHDNNFPAIMFFNPLNPPFREPGSPALIRTPYHVTAVSPGHEPGTIYINDQRGSVGDVEVPFSQAYRATKWPQDLLTTPGALDEAARAFQKAEKDPSSAVDTNGLRFVIHQLTPEQFEALSKRYRDFTGKRLQDFLKRYLPAEDLRMLGL